MNLSEIWPALAFLLALITAIATFVGWLWSQSNKNRAETAMELNKVRNDQQELRNEMYRDYMPKAGLEHFEKMLDEIKKQISELDKKFDVKIDNMRDDRRNPRA